MDKVVKTLDEQEVRDTFVSYLSTKMAKADWGYDYSDDPRVWRSGHYEISEITAELKLLSKLEGGLEEAKKLWEQHVPEYGMLAPSFLYNPELLNSVLNGDIMKRDIAEVQQILGVMQSNGDRFIAFESDALAIPEKRFIGFSTATEAHNFAYENTSPDITYKVYPIADLQKEIQCAIEPDMRKAYALKEVIDKMPNLGKDSREQELSR
ncbi:MAG TPA: hypothetical protein PKE30_09005 [Niabella sp.]|nr:hypothetical protein [Niabella sp.]